MHSNPLRGVIHGKTIFLDDDLGLPDGQVISLQIGLTPGEGIRLSAGAWADAGPDLEETLRSAREARHIGLELR
jgi:hypothetical protein